MILKTKSPQGATTPQAIAGEKQEQNVAFFLRRAFKDHPQVHVINDFRFIFNDETAQIDHLVIYPYGFILIESKSIKGHVKVNKLEEWTRSFNNRWMGIASPIKQVELQQKLLVELLQHNKQEIIGKLFGVKQQGFRKRCWDYLCVISSDAVIDRKAMPTAISNKLVKTEFLVDKLLEIMNLTNKLVKFIDLRDTRPAFDPSELDSVCDFIIGQHIGSNTVQDMSAVGKPQTSIPQKKPEQKSEALTQTQPEKSQLILKCKHCGEAENYTPMYGKFGYYIKCNQCTKNTPMKQVCPQCHSKNTKVQKRKETYTLNCLECGCGTQMM